GDVADRADDGGPGCVLEQVAAGAGGEGGGDVVVGVVGGEDEDLDRRVPGTDVSHELGAAPAGHAQVGDDDVDLRVSKHREGLLSARGDAHDGEVRLGVELRAQPV